MNSKIVKRVKEEGKYILETKKTLREMAKKFKVSKSTVHKDLQDRLIKIDRNMYFQVSKILQYHLNIRHIRGGEQTRRKYLKLDEKYNENML